MMERVFSVTAVTLNESQTRRALRLLRKTNTQASRHLRGKIRVAWGPQIDRKYVTLRLTDAERELIADVLAQNNGGPRWRAVYRDPKDPTVEVIVCTTTKPRVKTRVFRIAGGSHKLRLEELEALKK
jgi:hypothetical protein